MNISKDSRIPLELLNPSDEFKSAMDAMAIHWWYWDIVKKHLIISPGLVKKLGYAEEEFDPTVPTLDKNIHPEDSEENLKIFRKLLAGEADVYEMEYRLKVDGEWTWFYNRGTIILRDNGGSPLLAGGITMDISNRYSKLLEKVGEGSKFEFIFRNSTEAICVVSLGDENNPGQILEVNFAAAKLFECKPEDLIGLNPYKLLDPSLLENRNHLRSTLMASGSLKLDINTRNKLGKDKFLEVHTHAFRETGEEIFIALVIDKTESHTYKEELKASEIALRQSEKIYRSLIQAADDRIGLFDSEGNVVILNNAFTETIGFSMEEFLALKDRERIHPEDKKMIQGLSRELFKTGYLSTEYRVQHREGHYLTMNSKSVLLRDPDLDKDYILFIIRDVTDRINFQKELLKAKEKAIESDKLKSAFLANMSHEIRTPMNSIVGFANLLTEDDLDDDSKEEYVRRINKNSEQLLALISDIIDLAKIESNQLAVTYSKVILNNLFCELANYGQQQLDIRERDQVVFKNITEEKSKALIIESDLVRLTQIMQNLVNNAVKFTSAGEISIGFKLVDENNVCLFVKDTGTGIDRQNFEIIFDQFRQIDGSNVRKYGGTGLGLAICKNLAGLLNGRIWVESEKGVGSTFFVELPVKSGYSVFEEKRQKATKNTGSREITVLMVDDDQDSLMLMVTMMRNEGIQTLTADSGYKALEILEREGIPDIVLMDLEMPVLNGLQTLRIIRELYPHLKVIAQSAHAREGESERTKIAGFDDYISKPYSKQGLLDMIRRMVKV